MEVERVLMLKADEDVKQNPPRGTVVEKFNHDSQNVTPESSSLMKDPKRLGYLDWPNNNNNNNNICKNNKDKRTRITTTTSY